MTADVHLAQLEFDGRPAGEGFDGIRTAFPSAPAHPVDPIRLNTGVTEFTDLGTRTARLSRALSLPPGVPVVVQADCTGMSLALTAAAHLTEAGHDVRLVQLFNPEAVTTAHVEATYRELADKLGTPPEASRHLVRGCVETGGSPDDQLRTLREGLVDAGASFARSLGVPEAEAGAFSLELIDRYCGWLNFLLSCLDAGCSGAGTVHVYRTRSCPAVDGLRSAASRFDVRQYDGPDTAMNCPELLADAIADLRDHVGAADAR